MPFAPVSWTNVYRSLRFGIYPPAQYTAARKHKGMDFALFYYCQLKIFTERRCRYNLPHEFAMMAARPPIHYDLDHSRLNCICEASSTKRQSSAGRLTLRWRRTHIY